MLNLNILDNLQSVDNGSYPNTSGGLYCPSCGDYRRMQMSKRLGSTKHIPSVFEYICVQCQTSFTAVIYKSPDGAALAVLPSCRGGLTTPHTPDGVAYYLDQASKSQAIGANSAAIGMFRGALEHLLYEQGYKQGMLGTKLQNLENDIAAKKAPKWAMELETEFLDVINKLGNGAIHPNDGDITKQAALDSELIELVKETFHMLLFVVYEQPHQKQQKLDALRKKASTLRK